MNKQYEIPKPSASYNVVIVGSGFAGIVAAGILAEKNLSILMVDENLHIGGQLLRKVPPHLGEYPRYSPDYVKKLGFGFVENIRNQKITIMNRTTVVGIYPGNRLMLETERREIYSVTGETVLFATGARERFIPFKGWTLPGVYSTGMMQVLMKSSGVLPAADVLIGGSGLFLFSVGYEMLKNKGRVQAILEQSGMMDKIKMLPTLFHMMSKAGEGARYMSRLFFSGVPVKYRHKIVEARGKNAVEEVVAGKCDVSGRLIPGTEKIYKTSALAVGYGFIPNVEGPQMAGCELEFAANKGGWVVQVKNTMETSVAEVLAAGEITGVGGALKSINEGRIAALTLLKKFSRIAEAEFNSRLAQLSREREHHLQFMHYFNELYSIPAGYWDDIPDDVVVCRCEDVEMGEIRQGIAMGFTTPQGIKTAVRASMGNCQGRTCGPMVYDLLMKDSLQPRGSFGPYNVRPPLKPVTIEALSQFGKEE